jgi:hypothetical protein
MNSYYDRIPVNQFNEITFKKIFKYIQERDWFSNKYSQSISEYNVSIKKKKSYL